MNLASARIAIYNAVRTIPGVTTTLNVTVPTDTGPILSLDVNGISGTLNADSSILRLLHSASLPSFAESQTAVILLVVLVNEALAGIGVDYNYVGIYLADNDLFQITWTITTDPYLGWSG